jgi:chaperonin cofactor prefoldin
MAKLAPKQTKLTPVSFRLDPKVKFAAEILARYQRRSLASTVEWALLRSLEGTVQVGSEEGAAVTLNELVNISWSEDELIRSVNIAFLVPHMATHEESCIKAIILASAPLCFTDKGPHRRHGIDKVNFDALFLLRDLVKERASILSVSGELKPITEKEWAKVFIDSGALGAYRQDIEVAGENLEQKVENLSLKIQEREQYIISLQEEFRGLKAMYESLETESTWNRVNLK